MTLSARQSRKSFNAAGSGGTPYTPPITAETLLATIRAFREVHGHNPGVKHGDASDYFGFQINWAAVNMRLINLQKPWASGPLYDSFVLAFGANKAKWPKSLSEFGQHYHPGKRSKKGQKAGAPLTTCLLDQAIHEHRLLKGFNPTAFSGPVTLSNGQKENWNTLDQLIVSVAKGSSGRGLYDGFSDLFGQPRYMWPQNLSQYCQRLPYPEQTPPQPQPSPR